jgi:hypothetical protein
VEFALVVPVLLAIVMGIIDFGWLERNTLVIANAAREGARSAALGQPTSSIYARIRNAGKPTLQADTSGHHHQRLGRHAARAASARASGHVAHVTHAHPTHAFLRRMARGQRRHQPAKRRPIGQLRAHHRQYNHRSITGLFNRTVEIPVMMRREG